MVEKTIFGMSAREFVLARLGCESRHEPVRGRPHQNRVLGFGSSPGQARYSGPSRPHQPGQPSAAP